MPFTSTSYDNDQSLLSVLEMPWKIATKMSQHTNRSSKIDMQMASSLEVLTGSDCICVAYNSLTELYMFDE